VAEAVWRLLQPWHPITPPLFPIAREILLPACMVLQSAVATIGCTGCRPTQSICSATGLHRYAKASTEDTLPTWIPRLESVITRANP
jgi:hypothetical protein